ncbi:hypothetical protein Vadar_000422 [Vaccinium darrowii]|uniref:Uncharacterized protein n=1 Tax=Vaccinium darrowii TaxID=229202 RepID=A0ACB7YI56_9ERIC|nr:hypothetical protein Vadar_000422 [Vaccinium darrowii]
MFDLELPTTLLSCLLPFIILLIIKRRSIFTTLSPPESPENAKLPRSYPIIGSFFSIYANRNQSVQWTSEMVTNSPTSTFVLHGPFGTRTIYTGNTSNLHHILKSHFHLYEKGSGVRTTLSDFLGDGMFNINGDGWKFQRQVASHEFNNKSLRKFIEHVVDTEVNDRLVPILAAAAAENTVLDLQDILQRFGFDNVCAISFGYDPASLVSSLPQVKFMLSFEQAIRLTSQRFGYIHPLFWRAKRFLNFGSEKNLRNAVDEVRQFAKKIIKEKKQLLNEKSELESFDLLSRFLSSGHSDEEFITDIVVSFILAGRDTTSAALIWFFWLVSSNPNVEKEILEEIYEKSESPIFEEVKHMVYIQASLSESMRLYPPVPIDGKEATVDDVLPDGTFVQKGTSVVYHSYAMGRLEKIWGKDWAEFKPERWLEREDVPGMEGKWNFVGKDPYAYPVFQAGPRICLGKEMAFLQMKRVVAGVLRQFQVVPAFAEGKGPVYNLRNAVNEVRQFDKEIIKEKKQLLKEKSKLESFDLLSRFLSSGHSDEELITDLVINFIIAGRDTTLAALIWFFWLVSRNPNVEKEILKEIYEKCESPIFEEVKHMVYIQASLSESMRLYPPVPLDGKEAIVDDVLPDGTFIPKGTSVIYHPYAMGRLEKIWGKDWAEFKPEREVVREGRCGRGGREEEFRGKGPVCIPNVPSRAKDLFREGDGVFANEESGRRRLTTISSGAGFCRR